MFYHVLARLDNMDLNARIQKMRATVLEFPLWTPDVTLDAINPIRANLTPAFVPLGGGVHLDFLYSPVSVTLVMLAVRKMKNVNIQMPEHVAGGELLWTMARAVVRLGFLEVRVSTVAPINVTVEVIQPVLVDVYVTQNPTQTPLSPLALLASTCVVKTVTT
jgi:hypothetical protein